jgi:hypothetical protein
MMLAKNYTANAMLNYNLSLLRPGNCLESTLTPSKPKLITSVKPPPGLHLAFVCERNRSRNVSRYAPIIAASDCFRDNMRT